MLSLTRPKGYLQSREGGGIWQRVALRKIENPQPLPGSKIARPETPPPIRSSRAGCYMRSTVASLEDSNMHATG
jgi:hypothetical protein